MVTDLLAVLAPCRRPCALPAALLSFLVGACMADRAPGSDPVVSGYRQRIAGEELRYHSADPDVSQGLLVRSLDAARGIEWETAAVPDLFEGDAVRFVWLFALDVEPDGHRFELSVDGERWLEFRNPATTAVRDWEISGPGGASLRFRATTVDHFGDLMGYAILRVPRALLTPGRPLRLAVTGESAESRAWYITYQSPVSEGVRADVRPAVAHDGAGGTYRPVVLTVTHLGPPVDAVVSTSFGPDVERRLELGGNRFELRCPEVESPGEVRVAVLVEDEVRHETSARIRPVRRWTIDLVQHTHSDIGYTRPQGEILPDHLRFIDWALDCCDRTDGLPDEARFRWTCEVSWAVREYVMSRPPEQVERLRRRVAEGRIEVTGMFLNMSEIVDEASFEAFLRPIATLRELRFPVTTAMQNDVNGIAWCLADHFAQIGIDYLVMGQHGHRALAPFELPTCFWWESPSGSRVLAYRADHYMTGNFWGVHTGEVESVEEELLRYLTDLEERGYPFDRVAVQHSGYPTDNSPPSIASSALVMRWNETYAWPKLRCSVARDFLDDIASRHAADLEVRRQAWPDWWTDGFGSAARETAAARRTQADLVAVEGLTAIEAVLGVDVPAAFTVEADAIREDLLFYGEHTFGAAESIRDPFAHNSVVQWSEKAAYVWSAVQRVGLLAEKAWGRLPVAQERGPRPRLVVVNTLGFARSGLVQVRVDHGTLPIDRPFVLRDEEGTAVPHQLVGRRDDASTWAIQVPEIPALGWRTFRIEVGEPASDRTVAPREPATELANDWYRLRVDPETGSIASLVDLESGQELVDADSEWGFGQLVHEALGNREQLEGFRLEDFTRRTMTGVEVEGTVDGPVWSSLSVRGELPGCDEPGGARLEIRLFHAVRRIELHYAIHKRRVFEPEGLYVAFPFAVGDGEVTYEAAGAVVAPTTDVLPGAATDWQTVQSFVAVRNEDGQVVLSTDEIPLVQLGAINLGEFRREVVIERPHVYSWVMNNYWTTNFRAGQEGEFRWSYALTTDSDTSRARATRFGWSARIPLLARVLPGGGAELELAAESLLPLDLDGVCLVSARPARDRDGVVLHLREVEGRRVRLDPTARPVGGRRAQAQQITILEDDVGGPDVAIELGPYETRFYRLRFE